MIESGFKMGELKSKITVLNIIIAMSSNNKVYKKSNSVTYKVSLLMKSPLNGREIKIESSDGDIDIYTLQNASYESAQLEASIYAHNITIYKVAPGYTYYYE